jgi:hypothetical protein
MQLINWLVAREVWMSVGRPVGRFVGWLVSQPVSTCLLVTHFILPWRKYFLNLSYCKHCRRRQWQILPRKSSRAAFLKLFQVGTTFISQDVLRTTLLLSPFKANCLRFSTIVCGTQFTFILFFLSFTD